MSTTSWLEPVSVSLISGVVGVCGVLAGSWLTARNDNRRWERELQREQDRQHREDDRYWIEERRRAYAQYLAAVEPWMIRVRYWETPYFDPESTTESLRAAEEAFDSGPINNAMTEADEDIKLIGSQAASDAADSLHAQLFAFEATHIVHGTKEQLDMMAKECERRYDRLRSTLREDLGIPNAELGDT